MCKMLIPKTNLFHDFPPVWAPEPFRSQKSNPRGVPDMYRTVLTKTYRFHDFHPVWAPEPFWNQKLDPRGVQVEGSSDFKMGRSLFYSRKYHSRALTFFVTYANGGRLLCKTELWPMGRLSFKGARPVMRRNT